MIPIKGVESIRYLPSKDSFSNLIIYISHRSDERKIKESFYWNKLYEDIPQEELFIIGMVPRNETIAI
ncbi:MAG: hypothetical protein N3B16_12270 [Candidatus Aminicenantes bacterium]|nr:hypothetical protein [Candidatus Aminicenantes bacterium]